MKYLILYIFLGTHPLNSLPVSDSQLLSDHYCEELTPWQSVKDNIIITSRIRRSDAVCDGENNSVLASYCCRRPTKVCPTPHNDEKKTSRNEILTQSTPIFEGIHKVHVSLEPKSIPAKVMAMFVKPQGETYIKLTTEKEGAIRVQFCDSEGNVRVSINNGTGFYAGAMPKRLYLTDVKFRYKNGKIIDAQNGENKVTVLPCSDCSGKEKQWTEKQIYKKTKSSKNAVIIPKEYLDILEIEIELNLSVAFNAVIKEIK